MWGFDDTYGNYGYEVGKTFWKVVIILIINYNSLYADMIFDR